MVQKIGSLQADLKLESAAFIRQLRQAAQETARNTSKMQQSMAKLQKGFAGMASAGKGFIAGFVTVAAVRQMAALGAKAIQTADDIATAATKMNVAADQLQRLRFGAEQVDVSVEGLDKAFTRFTAKLAEGKIEKTGRTIEESFRNWIGKIAEAPTHLEKVRLASEVMGVKGYQDAILLASGFETFNAEAKKAFALSNDVLATAGVVDNQLRSLKNAAEVGFNTGFIEGFASSLDSSQEKLDALNETAKDFGNFVGTSIGQAIKAYQELDAWLEANLPEWLKARIKGMAGMGGSSLPGLTFGDFSMGGGGAPPPTTPGLGEGIDEQAEAAEATKAHAEALRLLDQQLQNTASSYNAILNPIDAFNARMVIAADSGMSFSQAQGEALASVVADYGNMAHEVTGALGSIFRENKGIAIAEALINTAVAATKALATYPPPLSFAMAGLQTAAGLAQVAAIHAQEFHAGGLVGRDGKPRMISAEAFEGAQRFHNGLKADEFPAILQRGEEVISKNMTGVSRGMNVNVNTSIDARGADKEGIAALRREIAKRDAELPGRIVLVVRDAQSRRRL